PDMPGLARDLARGELLLGIRIDHRAVRRFLTGILEITSPFILQSRVTAVRLRKPLNFHLRQILACAVEDDLSHRRFEPDAAMRQWGSIDWPVFVQRDLFRVVELSPESDIAGGLRDFRCHCEVTNRRTVVVDVRGTGR